MKAKKYIDARGWKYKVMGGIGENTYKARYQKPEKHRKSLRQPNWLRSEVCMSYR